VFTDIRSTIAALQIHEVVTAPRSPWQNAYVERLIQLERFSLNVAPEAVNWSVLMSFTPSASMAASSADR
jgi:hypothetical protein